MTTIRIKIAGLEEMQKKLNKVQKFALGLLYEVFLKKTSLDFVKLAQNKMRIGGYVRGIRGGEVPQPPASKSQYLVARRGGSGAKGSIFFETTGGRGLKMVSAIDVFGGRNANRGVEVYMPALARRNSPLWNPIHSGVTGREAEKVFNENLNFLKDGIEKIWQTA